jgi:hypothetical protein
MCGQPPRRSGKRVGCTATIYSAVTVAGPGAPGSRMAIRPSASTPSTTVRWAPATYAQNDARAGAFQVALQDLPQGDCLWISLGTGRRATGAPVPAPVPPTRAPGPWVWNPPPMTAGPRFEPRAGNAGWPRASPASPNAESPAAISPQAGLHQSFSIWSTCGHAPGSGLTPAGYAPSGLPPGGRPSADAASTGCRVRRIPR